MVKNCLFSWQADESGSDSDGADSTSSSYSSLSDFVTDMVNSEIDGDTPGMVVLVKLSSIYRIYWNRWEYPMHDCHLYIEYTKIYGDTPGIAVHVKFSFIYRIDRNWWEHPRYDCTCKAVLYIENVLK